MDTLKKFCKIILHNVKKIILSTVQNDIAYSYIEMNAFKINISNYFYKEVIPMWLEYCP